MRAPLRVFLSALGLAISAGSARAQQRPGLDLTWSAPEGCPNHADVLAGIVELLGSDRTLNEGAPLRAAGVVRSGVFGFRLELSFPSPSAEAVRQIESDRCDELDEAAALILALSLDPNNPRLAAARLPASAFPAPAGGPPAAPPSAPPPPPPPSAPVAPPPVAAAAPSPSPAARESVRFVPPSAGARFAVDVGTLPSVAFGGALSVSIPFDPVVGRAEFSFFAPQTETVDGAGGTFFFGALSILPCWPLGFGRVRVSPCAVLEADAIVASGEGVDEPEQPFTWFPRLGLGGELDYALSSRVALAAGIFGLIAPARPRFVVAEVELFQPSLFSARFSAGVDVAF